MSRTFPPFRTLPPLILTGLLAAGCGDVNDPDPGPGPCEDPIASDICLRTLATGLRYPLQLVQPEGDARLFVAEQAGRIRILRDDALVAEPFLDLTAEVLELPERGLLGMAFHPEFETNGHLYVTFTDLEGNTRIQRFSADPGADRVDLSTRKEILVIERESGQHSGGLLRFGPDGLLWIAVGDALQVWSPQDSSLLYGSLLRIDVDGGDPYAIPDDNPFVGVDGARPEIWAMGLRNPWRFSFESGGRLFVADVGEGSREELNIVDDDVAGLNYGWPYMEGSECFVDNCDPAGLVLPAFDYGRDVGCSILGGTIYTRSDLPALNNRYVLADYCGWVGSLAVTGTEASDLQILDFGSIGVITSLGTDAEGRLYVMGAETVSRLDPVP